MFETSVQNGFLFYVSAWLVMLVILWVRELWRHKVYDWALSEGALCICEHCHHAFLVKPGETVARCGRCTEICKIKKKRLWI